MLAAATQRTRTLWNRLNEPDPSVVEAFTRYQETPMMLSAMAPRRQAVLAACEQFRAEGPDAN